MFCLIKGYGKVQSTTKYIFPRWGQPAGFVFPSWLVLLGLASSVDNALSSATINTEQVKFIIQCSDQNKYSSKGGVPRVPLAGRNGPLAGGKKQSKGGKINPQAKKSIHFYWEFFQTYCFREIYQNWSKTYMSDIPHIY